MKRHLKVLLAMAVVPAVAATAFLAAQPASAASLTKVTGFGTNPSNLNMYTYIPAKLAAKPAMIVVIHYCTGSASGAFNQGKDYVTGADKYGYVLIFPETVRAGQCFDVWSPKGLKRDGGSDSQGIASMVKYATDKYSVDTSKIFVTGFSSGAMMTNVMAAEYPDVFAAGAPFMGVPATCFSTGSDSNTWNNQCSGGSISKTGQAWGDAARAMYPGYTGKYPRMQLWHGANDTTLSSKNLAEEVKQWTNLNGVSEKPVKTDQPQSGWTRNRYGTDTVQAPVESISIAGVGHQLPQSGQIPMALAFFGIS